MNRIAGYNRLQQFAGSVDAPPNDVFDDGQVETNERLMEASVSKFAEALQQARQETMAESPARARAILAQIDKIDRLMRGVIADGRSVFSTLRAGGRSEAEASMARMDRGYANVQRELEVIDQLMRDFQIEEFQLQVRHLAMLRRYEYIVAALIALGVVATVMAGALVARQAMLPLARITTATQRLNVARLDHPLDDYAWPEELRDLAAEFAQMQVRLRDSFQRLTGFSDDLAHELRTPVNNLMGAGEVALGQPRSADEYRETIASMLEEAQRVRRMIDELLFLARAEQPEKSLQRVSIDAREEAAAVVDFFSAVADDKSVTLSIDGRGTVFANRDLLRRALSNLVGNALQHTPAGGSVRIVIFQDGQSTSMEVHDTGVGIESQHLGRLFDRFYRVDEARSSYPDGTGLGLSIVRSIMTLHGGTVTVASQPGRGSLFTLTFPGR
jgi:heavy metal sensor kinase